MTDSNDEALEGEPRSARSSIGFGSIFSLFALALGGGAFGGWALGHYVMPKFVASPYAQTPNIQTPNTQAPNIERVDLQPLLSRLTAAEEKLEQHSAGLTRFTAQLSAQPARITVGKNGESANAANAPDLATLLARITALEERAATPQKLGDAGEAGSSVSDALVSDESETSMLAANYLEKVEQRLVTLEKSLSEISQVNIAPFEAAQAEAAQIELEQYDEKISALRLRIDEVERALSAELENTKALAATPTIVKEPVLLPPFPRQAMLEILSTPEDTAQQGWIGKTLKKHISVRNPEDVARANAALDAIEKAAISGDYKGALAQLSELPSQARSAARDWAAALEREVDSQAQMRQTQPRQTLGDEL